MSRRAAKAIDDLVDSRGAEVIARFTEVESGKTADRSELAKARHLAKVTGATLLIGKLDRLSRNAAFLLTLRDSGVKFVAGDTAEANELTVGIMRSWPNRSGRRSLVARGGAGGRQGARCASLQPKRRRGSGALDEAVLR